MKQFVPFIYGLTCPYASNKRGLKSIKNSYASAIKMGKINPINLSFFHIRMKSKFFLNIVLYSMNEILKVHEKLTSPPYTSIIPIQ